MARENEVIIHGYLVKDPVVEMIDEAYQSARIVVKTAKLNKQSLVGWGKNDYTTIKCITGETELIQEIETWKKFTFVEISGTVVTKVSEKEIPDRCPKCGNVNSVTSYEAQVYIKDAVLDRDFNDEEKAKEHLNGMKRFANRVFMLGNVCVSPQKKAGKIVEYQLAVGRHFSIQLDDPDVKTDYPWIKNYGADGNEDLMRLNSGTCAFISGYLQRRPVNKKCECAACHSRYEYMSRVLEVVPYRTADYITRANDDETVRRMTEERERQSVRDTIAHYEEALRGLAAN